MPELPEVETIARGLSGPLTGRVLVRVEQRRPDLRRPFPANFARRLTGRRVESVGRRAKYLLVGLDAGPEGRLVWLIHLGMSGRLVLGPPSLPGPHDHVMVGLDDGQALTFNDPRRFGVMDLFAELALETHELLRDIGPEPLGNAFSPSILADRLAGKAVAIKQALLDQKLVAGIGNIYASEALWRARIHPALAAGKVKPARIPPLYTAIRDVLEEAIAAGGSSLRDYVQASGEMGYFQHGFAVYDRAGEPCKRCGTPIEKIVQGGRATFFCPKCQK